MISLLTLAVLDGFFVLIESILRILDLLMSDHTHSGNSVEQLV